MPIYTYPLLHIDACVYVYRQWMAIQQNVHLVVRDGGGRLVEWIWKNEDGANQTLTFEKSSELSYVALGQEK